MTKWADFLISAVKYDSDRKITHVKIHQDSEDGLGKEEIIDRSSLADNLKKYSYMTVYSGINTWKKGEKLKVFFSRFSTFPIDEPSKNARIF